MQHEKLDVWKPLRAEFVGLLFFLSQGWVKIYEHRWFRWSLGLLYSLSFPIVPHPSFLCSSPISHNMIITLWFYPMSCITILINFASPVSVFVQTFISFIGFFYLHFVHVLYHHWIELCPQLFLFTSSVFFSSLVIALVICSKEILHLVFTSFLLFEENILTPSLVLRQTLT